MHRNDILQEAYDRAAADGIKTVLHCGDITDGFYKIRPTHIYELDNMGADEQIDDVVANYPMRDGVKTYFITGNHDETHIMNGGINVCKNIAMRRDDMVYVGHDNAS